MKLKNLKRLAALAVAACLAAPALALDGVPVTGVQWYINPSTGAIVGYRNPVTQQDTATLGALSFGALTATTGSFSSTLSATGNFAINTNKFTVTASSGATSVAGTLTAPVLVATTSSSPASNAACTAGTIYWDADYIYVCTATGAVKRAALTGGY